MGQKADANVVPLIVVARDQHHPDWRERHSEPAPLTAGASVVQTMAHTLTTKAVIKSGMGFRQFSLRGLELVSGEGSCVCLA